MKSPLTIASVTPATVLLYEHKNQIQSPERLHKSVLLGQPIMRKHNASDLFKGFHIGYRNDWLRIRWSFRSFHGQNNYIYLKSGKARLIYSSPTTERKARPEQGNRIYKERSRKAGLAASSIINSKTKEGNAAQRQD